MYNIAVYPLGGLGPELSVDKLWLVPIEPLAENEYPLFHRSTWSPLFRDVYNTFQRIIKLYPEVYNDYVRNMLTNGGRKMPLEELGPEGFQAAWIKDFYMGKYPYDIGLFLRRVSKDPKSKWKGIVKKRNIRKYASVLFEIPLAKDPKVLISRVSSMKEYFYNTEPRNHYPFL